MPDSSQAGGSPRPRSIVPIICSGEPFQMGTAQGFAVRERIRSLVADLERLEAFRLAQPAWLPFPLYRFLAQQKAERYLRTALRNDELGIRRRLDGIVAGADASRGAICLFNSLEPFLSDVGDHIGCAHACSAVAVRGSRSATGEPVISRNFDYLELVQPYHILRENHPRRGLRSLEFTVAPLAGAMDGINEAGLCIVYDYAFTMDRPKAPAPSISMIISSALERCRTVDEAVRFISDRPRWGSALLMLADQTGDIASLELSNTTSSLIRPPEENGFCFHTNQFSGENTKAFEAPADAVFSDNAPKALRGRRLHESAEARDARWAQLLSGSEALTLDALALLLADHGPDGKPGAHTPCMHSDYWNTTTSVQLLPRSRRMRIAFERPCKAHYQEFSL